MIKEKGKFILIKPRKSLWDKQSYRGIQPHIMYICFPYCYAITDWFQVRKGVGQACILSPCLFNLYAEYTVWNAELDETQARIKIAGRDINNLRYAHDTTLMAESKEEVKSLLIKVEKGEWNSWLKTQ